MKKALKWLGIIIGTLVLLLVLALLVIPMFYDVQKFKPHIERAAQEATGRRLVLGGELELSLFPWAGITLTDVSLGSPDGFGEENFAAFSEFEVRMKLLPLISGDVQVKHVVLRGLRLVLERRKDGQVNWEFAKTDATKEEPAQEGISIKTLAVGEISITDGEILYIDRQSDSRKELSDVNATLADLSFDKPIHLDFSARLDGKPFSLKGTMGPLGSDPGKGTVDVDLAAGVFDVMTLELNGQVTNPASAPEFQLEVVIPDFSPRRLIREVAPDVDIATSDPSVLEEVSLQVKLSGTADSMTVSDGTLVLDYTRTSFQAGVREFQKPNISWQVNVDNIDLDRYLPKAEGKKEVGSDGGAPDDVPTDVKKEKTDYATLRGMVLDGGIKIDSLKAGGGTFRDMVVKITGRGGIFKIDPVSVDLYEGSVVARCNFDVTGDVPLTVMEIQVDDIQAEPLLKDFMNKDFLTGTALAQISLSMTGDSPERIKQTLDGKGTVQFRDGAIRGVDILGMIHNLKAAFGLADPVQKPETEFSEFDCPFMITGGIVETTAAQLRSPVLRVAAAGKAHLVEETLDFRIDPTWVNPEKEDEDGRKITGSLVPVSVTGTFSNPKFRPDVEEAAKKAVTKALTDLLKGDKESEENGDEQSESPSSTEDAVKNLLNQLPFGQ